MKRPRLTMNLCNLPSWAIASRGFNENPRPIVIQGVRGAHRQLFLRLDAQEDPALRGAAFHDYMDVAFQLHQWKGEESELGRRSLRNSYLRFLRGWMFDANSMEGAVLKGWVESRFGIPPTFHREPIDDIHSDAYSRYTIDRMNGMARTNSIQAQLDVLYEFTQYELARRNPDSFSFTLFRGVHDFSEHRVLENLSKDRCILLLNNLNSFTRDFERAWEFGSRVLEAIVPAQKIFFRADLLPLLRLKGEEEVIVIGGEYEVRVRTS
ncbi:MAG: NAD(+)--dinitrogen-reductase ADP-D-ribosyltransferase [Deltaproteobacteria bacterium]|nr:NAD(+)--dinitrogen-reductase ADP-D-ribosyltransferase [Deltaproteobacteria bacterium]